MDSTNVTLSVIADTDADGIPISGRAVTLAIRPIRLRGRRDGDGMSNFAEYIAGTDPTNALSVLKFMLTTTNRGLLEFVAQTNIGYAVQYRTNLNSALWNNVTSISAQSLVQTVRVTAPYPPPESRFYRIITPPAP
jgi:hypothetical protein